MVLIIFLAYVVLFQYSLVFSFFTLGFRAGIFWVFLAVYSGVIMHKISLEHALKI